MALIEPHALTRVSSRALGRRPTASFFREPPKPLKAQRPHPIFGSLSHLCGPRRPAGSQRARYLQSFNTARARVHVRFDHSKVRQGETDAPERLRSNYRGHIGSRFSTGTSPPSSWRKRGSHNWRRLANCSSTDSGKAILYLASKGGSSALHSPSRNSTSQVSSSVLTSGPGSSDSHSPSRNSAAQEPRSAGAGAGIAAAYSSSVISPFSQACSMACLRGGGSEPSAVAGAYRSRPLAVL